MPLFALSYIVPTDQSMVKRADAIVVARATSSHADESARGIVTYTTFAVEDVVKGDASLLRGITVREPGGIIETVAGKRIRLFPGAPRFTDGEKVLLHLKDVGDGLYAVAELELGVMKLTTDDLGHSVAIRPTLEGTELELNGKKNVERRRDAERFIEYLRNIASGKPANDDYAIEPRPILRDLLVAGSNSLRPAPLAGFTITQYTMPVGAEGAMGARWAVFPSVVNWNRGTSMTHLSNGGSDAINTAFAAWASGTSVNFFLATTTSNLNGACGLCGDTADGVNNIRFEEDLTADGAANWVCGGAGIFGEGSPHAYSGTNSVGGETFQTITESDVSFNKGVDACIPSSISVELAGSALMHEIGHGLGLRHSDTSRDLSQPCTNFPSYDCEMNSAIMKAFVPNGLNSTRQAWDTRAITALYPPNPAPAAPTNVVASTVDATHVSVTWTASAGATKYHVYRCASSCSAPPTNYAQVNGETTTGTSHSDTVPSNVEYAYFVRAANGSNVESTNSNKDIGVGVAFTDLAITAGAAGTKVKGAHITELRTLAASLCQVAGNTSCSTWTTDPTITALSTTVKRLHIVELRAKVDAARSALGLTAMSYTDSTITTGATGTQIKKAHIDDLRSAVQ